MQNTFYFLSTQEYVTNLQNNSINDTFELFEMFHILLEG